MNYQNIYNSLINRAKQQSLVRIEKRKIREEYYEAHHIIPRCLGGLGKSSEYTHENIVLLTAKEHYICHALLCEIYPNNYKLKLAHWMMCNGARYERKYKISSKQYSRLKQEIATIQSIQYRGKSASLETKQKISSKLKGKPKSKEHKEKLKISVKSRPIISEETRLKMSLAKKGKSRPPRSEEYRMKISQAQKNRPKITEETRRKMSLAKKGKSRNEIQSKHEYSN